MLKRGPPQCFHTCRIDALQHRVGSRAAGPRPAAHQQQLEGPSCVCTGRAPPSPRVCTTDCGVHFVDCVATKRDDSGRLLSTGLRRDLTPAPSQWSRPGTDAARTHQAGGWVVCAPAHRADLVSSWLRTAGVQVRTKTKTSRETCSFAQCATRAMFAEQDKSVAFPCGTILTALGSEVSAPCHSHDNSWLRVQLASGTFVQMRTR